MENNQNNFATEEEANDLLFKLIKLKDDEVFFLAKSLDAEANDNPLSNAKNIISKLKLLPKDEFVYAQKFIDNLFKSHPKEEREKEGKNRIPGSDKLFFYFYPKVDLNTKAFFFFPIKTTNIIYSIFNIGLLIIFATYRFIIGISIDTIIQSDIKEYLPLLFITYIILLIIGNISLFISAKNDNYLSAKISLLSFELKYIIAAFGFALAKIITNLGHILLLFIGYYRINTEELNNLELLVSILFPIIFEFFPLYLSYLQVSITRIKGQIKNL